MSSITSVDVVGMIAAKASFDNALDECNTHYTRISHEQNHLQSIWTGEASTAFGQALSAYLADFNVVITQLNSMIDTLSSNTGVYKNAMDNTQQSAASFRAGLPDF